MPCLLLLHFLKQDQITRLVEVPQGNHFDVDHPVVAVLTDPHIFPSHHLAFLLRLADGSAQRQHQTFPRHFHQVEARLAGGRLKKRTGRAAKLQDLHLSIDQDAGWGVFVEGDAVGFVLQVQFVRESFGRGAWFGCRNLPGHARMPGTQLQLQRCPCRSLGIDLLLLIDGRKQVGKRANRFRRAQEQKPLRLQGVMKNGQDLLLHALFDVNQQVAATDEVHARKGGIGDEILSGEDTHLADGLVDSVAAVLLGKEASQPFR